MQRLIKSLVTISALSSLLVIPALFSASQAFAGQKGTDASYFGGAVAAGITNGGQNGDAATLGGSVVTRLNKMFLY